MSETNQMNFNGYQLTRAKTVSEIHIDTYQFEHTKSGARVLYLKNDDPNKVFTIAFKTPPENDTGCPHILEHSVLNGSQHFPAKNTFTELMKGSMKTFLNAFTGSDRTMYPIASTNDKDFMNLMHVYLDAVLYPNIYNSPEILMQEGWHHELFNPEDEIVYRGVVYNEMKGAFSSPESVLMRKIEQVQLPDTPYHFESGGDPEAIPNLTWERFKAFHTRYYHPSNSYIFLYGDLDIAQVLDFMDKEYLSKFDRIDPQSDIPLQKPFAAPVRVEEDYSIGTEDDPQGKSYLSINVTCGRVTDVMTTSALSTLDHILMESAASPLKRALQECDLCDDSFSSFDDSCQQPNLSLICKHVKDDNIDAMKDFVFEQLRQIAKNGLDKKLIEATINSKEFAWREAEMSYMPKGLIYSMNSCRSWIQGGDPLAYLEFEPILAYLRKGLTEPLFEGLIEKYILNNPHSSLITLKPVQGLVGQRDEQTRLKLKSYKESLTTDQIKELAELNHRLQAWQSEPDTKADLDKIPFITLADIRKEAEPLDLAAEQKSDVTLLKHDVETHGIAYLSMYFELSQLSEDELPWVELITEFIGSVDSTNMSYAALSNEIDIHTGGISLNLALYENKSNPATVNPRLFLTGKSLFNKVEILTGLMAEYAWRPKFDDVERLHQLVREFKSRLQMSLISGGHSVATRIMLAQTSLLHRWQDMVKGMGYYEFLQKVENQLAVNPAAVTAKLTVVLNKMYSRRNLVVSITAPEQEIPAVWNSLAVYTDQLSNDSQPVLRTAFEPRKANTGIFAPVNIQFCAKGGIYHDLGYAYTGKMMVLTNILRNDFLMTELRVKGGAYGIMVNFSRYGYISFCSYRDPNLTNTLAVYDRIPQYLRAFDCPRDEFEKYIIGTVAELDMPPTPSQKGYTADYYYLTGLTFADRQQIRNEVLATTIEDIRKFANLIEAVMQMNQYAVYGVETVLKQHSSLFDVLIPAIPGGA